MTFEEIKELIAVFDESGLAKLKVEQENFKINLDKTSTTTTQVVSQPQNVVAPTAVEAVAQPQTQDNNTNNDKEGDFITSPMVGTFYQAPSPSSPAYVKTGDKVRQGQTVCIVEAMKIMNEIQAEFDCEILEILVQDGQAVEFGTPLFRVKRV